MSARDHFVSILETIELSKLTGVGVSDCSSPMLGTPFCRKVRAADLNNNSKVSAKVRLARAAADVTFRPSAGEAVPCGIIIQTEFCHHALIFVTQEVAVERGHTANHWQQLNTLERQVNGCASLPEKPRTVVAHRTCGVI